MIGNEKIEKKYQPKNLLVTGGAGFIGTNFIYHILSCDTTVQIVNLDALTYAGCLANLKPLSSSDRYTFVHGNICDVDLINDILHKFQIDTIVHFAAESHVDRSIQGPSPFIHTNVVGTFTLLEAARQFWLEGKRWGDQNCRFHHISTDEVYGSLESDSDCFTEKTPYAPSSPYSATKAGSDHLVRAYFKTYGVPVTISNCSNNYGPYQHDEKFIPKAIQNCLRYEPIPIYGNGCNIRDWLYVTDHCEAIGKILTHGIIGETYNIGGNNEMSNIDVATQICASMDVMSPKGAPHKKLLQHVTDRPGHDWRYGIDASFILRTLGWAPKETFESGLHKTMDFYGNLEN